MLQRSSDLETSSMLESLRCKKKRRTHWGIVASVRDTSYMPTGGEEKGEVIWNLGTRLTIYPCMVWGFETHQNTKRYNAMGIVERVFGRVKG